MVGEQVAGEPQLGVGGDDEPGPAVGLLGQTTRGVVQPRVFLANRRVLAAVGLDERVVDALGLQPGEQEVPQPANRYRRSLTPARLRGGPTRR